MWSMVSKQMPFNIILLIVPFFVQKIAFHRLIHDCVHHHSACETQQIWYLFIAGFSSETMHLDGGLFVELWNKGILWDNLLGCHFLTLNKVTHSYTVNLQYQLFFHGKMFSSLLVVLGGTWKLVVARHRVHNEERRSDWDTGTNRPPSSHRCAPRAAVRSVNQHASSIAPLVVFTRRLFVSSTDSSLSLKYPSDMMEDEVSVFFLQKPVS